MPITTLETAKTYLQIKDTSKDALIIILISRVESDYLSIRNKPFDTDENGEIIYPDGAESVASDMIGYLLNKKYGVRVENLADYQQTFEDATIKNYPKSIVGSIKRYLNFL